MGREKAVKSSMQASVVERVIYYQALYVDVHPPPRPAPPCPAPPRPAPTHPAPPCPAPDGALFSSPDALQGTLIVPFRRDSGGEPFALAARLGLMSKVGGQRRAA